MATLFTRTYTFTDGTVAYGSQVETEIANIVTVLNSLNTATTNWGQVSALHATSVPLVADCSSGTQHIADFKNNSTIKFSVASDGTIDTKGTATVEGGDITISTAGSGIVLKNPAGNKTYRLYVDNNGVLNTLELT